MLLEIDDWRTVGDLQYRFNKCFTNLHLQVFKSNSKTRFENPLPPGCSLEHIRGLHRAGVLCLKSWFTCQEAERLLLAYGLTARVVKLEDGAERWLPSFADQTLGQLNERTGFVRQNVLVPAEEEQLAGW